MTYFTDELAKKIYHLKTLNEVSKEIFFLDNPSDIINIFLLMVIGSYGSTKGIAFLLNEDGKEIEVFNQQGVEGNFENDLIQLVKSQSLKTVMEIDQPTQLIGDDERLQKDVFLKFLNINDFLIFNPFKLNNKFMGGLALGAKLLGDPYSVDDLELLSTLVNQGVISIENARINSELRSSYEAIKSLNKAKDRIIEHLSHELRTPLSVLSASLGLLACKDYQDSDTVARLLDRSRRNLQRLSDMQSKIADITRNPDYQMRRTSMALLDLCVDELESLVDVELGLNAGKVLRRRIDEWFRPRGLELKHIAFGSYVSAKLTASIPLYSHRRMEIIQEIEEDAGFLKIPDEILDKIITGLIRNAVEYTPDGGQVRVIARQGINGPELTVTDTGIGITIENQQLIFGNYFTTADISTYGTGTPYNFNAGGRGLDLLRMQVFSEQYNFKIILQSYRCPHIPRDSDVCPGRVENCEYCDSPVYCHHSGGTSFTIRFNPKSESLGQDR